MEIGRLPRILTVAGNSSLSVWIGSHRRDRGTVKRMDVVYTCWLHV